MLSQSGALGGGECAKKSEAKAKTRRICLRMFVKLTVEITSAESCSSESCSAESCLEMEYAFVLDCGDWLLCHHHHHTALARLTTVLAVMYLHVGWPVRGWSEGG